MCVKAGPPTQRSCGRKKGGLLFPFLGLLSLVWFVFRVFPKPSRASYPCMRAAAPLASSFVIWLVGTGVSITAFRTGRKQFRKSRYLWAGVLFAAGVAGWFSVMTLDVLGTSAYSWKTFTIDSLPDSVNEPMGNPGGSHPGRVVWVHDPEATDWDGPDSGRSCWDPESTDQAVVDSMMSRAVRWLAGASSDEDAWQRLFQYINQRLGRGDRGYQEGEKIAVKINLTTCNSAGKADIGTREKTKYLDKAGDTSPQMLLALLRQLVNEVGVEQADISIGDPVAVFPAQWYDYLSVEFPHVHYLDHYAFPGRTQVQHSAIPIYWSTSDADGKLQDYLPVSLVEASYIINFAVLKGHGLAGITVCAKNHYGSLIRSPLGKEWGQDKNYYNLHESLPSSSFNPGRGKYRALVDLVGHAELGGKTVLYLIDGLYGGYYWEGTPYRWNMAPFNGDWPSSLFASQDPVAIDSVAYDFLLAEWPIVVEDGDGASGSLQGGAQDYLHEAALANDPPSGTFYDPERDGTAMAGLGVHEHWDNPVSKKYSRNLSTGNGIELIWSAPDSVTTPTRGDFNGDGEVSLADALLGLKVLSEGSLTTDLYRQAKVYEDEGIGLRGVLYILQKVSGVR